MKWIEARYGTSRNGSRTAKKKTTKKKAPFKGTYNIPLADPDSCNFQVAGLIPGESEKRGRVFTKIYNKG